MVEPRLSQLLWLSQFAMCYCCCTPVLSTTVRRARSHFVHEHAPTKHYFARAHRDYCSVTNNRRHFIPIPLPKQVQFYTRGIE